MKRKSKTSTFVPPEPQPNSRSLWAIMKAYSWGSLSIGYLPLTAPTEGPHRFIPVFDTREQAVKWNNGSEENIFEMRMGE